MKRKIGIIGGIGVLGILAWIVYSNVIQRRRDAAYGTTVASYQHDLHAGTTKADVTKYLRSRNVSYNPAAIGGRGGETYLIQIGEDPTTLVCEAPKVYVALEFGSDDRLSDVHLTKFRTCL